MGLTPKIAGRLQQQEVIRTMVANRFGYSIANIRPKSTTALDGRAVRRLRIAGDHKPMRLGLLRVARQEPTRLVSTFMDHCRTLISNSYIPGMEPPILDPQAGAVRHSLPAPSLAARAARHDRRAGSCRSPRLQQLRSRPEGP